MKKKSSMQNRITHKLDKDREDMRRFVKMLGDLSANFRYEGKPSWGKNLKRGQTLVVFFQEKCCGHMAIQERVLFPFIKKHVPKLEVAIAILRSEHSDLKKSMGFLKRSLDNMLKRRQNSRETGPNIDEIIETTQCCAYLASHHIRAEKEIVYKVIKNVLTDEENRVLWGRMKESIAAKSSSRIGAKS